MSTTINRYIISWKGKVFFDMKRNADDTWTTVKTNPCVKRRRPKKGPMAKLLRQHQKSMSWKN
jgi:hypothetical protein